MTRRRWIYLLFLVLTLSFAGKAVLSGAESKADIPAPEHIQPTGERLLRGKAVYDYYCSTCHGLKGNGSGPNAENLFRRPRNFTDKPYMNTKTDKDLYQVIKGGGNAVGLSYLMPPWGQTLSGRELFDVIVFVRTFEKGGEE